MQPGCSPLLLDAALFDWRCSVRLELLAWRASTSSSDKHLRLEMQSSMTFSGVALSFKLFHAPQFKSAQGGGLPRL